MQFSYRNYTHAENEVFISTTRRSLYSDAKVKIGFEDVYTINGRLEASTQALLTTAINDLRNAYGVDGGNLTLVDNSSANTSFVTLNNNTTGGVKIREISFPDLRGAQYTTFVDYTIVAFAETISTTGTYDTYSDSIAISGNGGPKRILMETALGIPVSQTVKQRTIVRATQSGSASSLGRIPAYPPFLFPGLVLDSSQIQKAMAASVENNTIRYDINWSYTYASQSAISAIPKVLL